VAQWTQLLRLLQSRPPPAAASSAPDPASRSSSSAPDLASGSSSASGGAYAISLPLAIREMTACLGPALSVALLLEQPRLCALCHELGLDAAFYR
jgi:hypothetical protein